jgi:hypothetical protein
MITSKRGWILRRWQLQAPEILRSLEKRTPLLPNGTNIPVLSVPFSPDRKWFEIVMAKRRQLLEDNRSRFQIC